MEGAGEGEGGEEEAAPCVLLPHQLHVVIEGCQQRRIGGGLDKYFRNVKQIPSETNSYLGGGAGGGGVRRAGEERGEERGALHYDGGHGQR